MTTCIESELTEKIIEAETGPKADGFHLRIVSMPRVEAQCLSASVVKKLNYLYGAER